MLSGLFTVSHSHLLLLLFYYSGRMLQGLIEIETPSSSSKWNKRVASLISFIAIMISIGSYNTVEYKYTYRERDYVSIHMFEMADRRPGNLTNLNFLQCWVDLGSELFMCIKINSNFQLRCTVVTLEKRAVPDHSNTMSKRRVWNTFVVKIEVYHVYAYDLNILNDELTEVYSNDTLKQKRALRLT